MKLSILLILFSLATMATAAQRKQPVMKDSLPAKQHIHNTTVPAKTSERRVSTEMEISKKLNNIVSAYTNKPNTQATWTQIRGEAENMLLRYFKNGALMGTKSEEAYFVKMGVETMTSTDIANHKMILQAGVATVKPAEFKIITIEKINTSH